MNKENKNGTGHSGSSSPILGKIGCNNIVKDMPVLMPDENMKMFSAMQKSRSSEPFGFKSPFDNFWINKH